MAGLSFDRAPLLWSFPRRQGDAWFLFRWVTHNRELADPVLIVNPPADGADVLAPNIVPGDRNAQIPRRKYSDNKVAVPIRFARAARHKVFPGRRQYRVYSQTSSRAYALCDISIRNAYTSAMTSALVAVASMLLG